jgi:hypothetical protein
MNKAIAIVAHPDDCVIYSYPFIYNNPQLNWEVCYLTSTQDSTRGKEVENFWKKRNIPVSFLGFIDDPQDLIQGKLNFNLDLARKYIDQKISDASLVLTHNKNGEYGHPHHKFINECCQHFPTLVTFAGESIEYTLPEDIYDLNVELPYHIKLFPDLRNTWIAPYKYDLSLAAKKLLNIK